MIAYCRENGFISCTKHPIPNLIPTRRSATANRSRVSIRGRHCKHFLTTFLRLCARMVPKRTAWLAHRNTLLPHVMALNFVAVGHHRLKVDRKSQKYGGCRAPLGWGVADPLETRSNRTCYPLKFDRCRSNRLGVGTRSQKSWRRWGPPLG